MMTISNKNEKKLTDASASTWLWRGVEEGGREAVGIVQWMMEILHYIVYAFQIRQTKISTNAHSCLSRHLFGEGILMSFRAWASSYFIYKASDLVSNSALHWPQTSYISNKISPKSEKRGKLSVKPKPPNHEETKLNTELSIGLLFSLRLYAHVFLLKERKTILCCWRNTLFNCLSHDIDLFGFVIRISEQQKSF